MKKTHLVRKASEKKVERKTSRLPGFYRLSVEQRLAFLARTFHFTNEQIAQLRDGSALRVEHAVNMVENTIGVFGLPLGIGLNFIVDEREHLVPMAIEEASIIAAASKGALIIRNGGGFTTSVDEPIMIGQVQVLDLPDIDKASECVRARKNEILDRVNEADPRMSLRGGGAFDIETRLVEGGSGVGRMLVVHILVNVCEAMGANAINSVCESAGPIIESITGGRVNLRILSNLADRRISRSEFALPIDLLGDNGISGEIVASRMVEASRLAENDPYRATTHNKGIFNGICAAAIAFGQDWRAIEAGGHAYAARDGQYRALAKYSIEGSTLVGRIELPMQVGWIGGAVDTHPAVKTLRVISGVQNSRELAGLLASVGLAQNFAACLALCTEGIQKGHMALHARSVAVSAGVSVEDVESVASEMIRRGEVKVSVAEDILRGMRLRHIPARTDRELPVESFAHGKVILFGEHSTVYNHPGIISTIDLGLTVKIKPDSDGPRFLNPHFKQAFPIPDTDDDVRLFSRAADTALEMYGLQKAPIAIAVESNLVPGMGLGSSAAFSVALCSALRQFSGAPSNGQWDAELFSEAQKLEAVFHGNPSGMDAATVLSGGVIWFRKGPPREILPIRMPFPMSGLVCIVEPGARTIELVERVRDFRRRDRETVDAIFTEIANVVVDAGIALGTGDEKAAGRLMVKNHELLARLGVSTPALDDAVNTLLDHGALGAKLTGAGGGGAVVALVEAERQQEIFRELVDQFALLFPFRLGANR
jgi:hydroxymethylglutaryl-CoA reductase